MQETAAHTHSDDRFWILLLVYGSYCAKSTFAESIRLNKRRE
ncbi:MAG: hypothetical protein ACK2U9_24985 [Anaerolineae bacterium]